MIGTFEEGEGYVSLGPVLRLWKAGIKVASFDTLNRDTQRETCPTSPIFTLLTGILFKDCIITSEFNIFFS